jgi:arylsulfatase A-like enzyme
MRNTRLLTLSMLGVALLGLSSRITTCGADSRPNIVVILADDLGWADLACYGADVHETPHIDHLAQQGVRFTDAYAAAPVCTPTRAALLTGKYPARLHMTIWYENTQQPPNPRRNLIPPQAIGNLPHAEVTLAEVLHEAGYLTAHVGKWHLGDAAHYPQTQGFDVNIGGTFWGAPSTFFFPYSGNWSRSTEFRYVPHLEFGEANEYLTDRLTDEAIRVMEKAGARPFFLYLAYHSVHTPIEGKPEHVVRFRERTASAAHHQNSEYAAMVYSLDENVGRILAKLEALGVAEETLVIFTSDNGGFINQYQGQRVTDNSPLRSGKGSLYEGGIRVPLIVRWPGVTPSSARCDAAVMTTDFYPTILEAVDLEGNSEHNREVDGVSLTGVLRDPSAPLARDTLFFHYPHYYPTTTPVSAVRHGDWKLLQYFETDQVELYNLADDLGEQHDLARQQPATAQSLRERLQAWHQEVDAQLPTPNPERSISP